MKSKNFTLVEMIIVLALISILAVILLVAIRPFEIFKKARDAQRIADLNRIDQIITVIYTQDFSFSELNYASPNVVYISLKDSSATCTSWLSQLPSLPSGWSYHCSATPTSMNGNGWIPIPFSDYPIIALSQLPIDPINQPPYYYSFVVGGSYEIEAKLESNFQASLNDGGDSGGFYEKGTNLTLTPPEARSGSRFTKDDVDKILKISCPTCSQGLVGYWPFDEGSGTIAKDYSGNNNNGTLCNGGTCPAQGPTWTTGKVGSALNFDGADDYVTIPDSPSINLGTGDFTLVAWIKAATTQTTYPQILSKRGTTANGFLFGLWSNGNLFMQIAGANYPIATDPNLRDNNWHYVVAVRRGSTVTYYIDGANKGSFTSTASMSSTHALWIGRDEPAAGFTPFNGLIDEIHIYNRALSDSEIKALYEATK
jgi:prepilin-type N-terminal cleavage/methylation domain-containing protein